MLVPVMLLLLALPAVTQAAPGEEWQAFWVWGTQHADRGKGFFRLSFALDGEIRSAILQGSGDDGYVLFANGREVLRSGFGFDRADVTDLTASLRPGANLLAAMCDNAAYPGGWLAQLHVTYADGRTQTIVSDRSTRFWHEEQTGWQSVEFDDTAWEQCREIARPPGGVWGPLPLQYAGPRDMLRLISFEAPEQVRAGETLTVEAQVEPVLAIASDRRAHLSLERHTLTAATVAHDPAPPTTAWAPGEPVTLTVPVPVSPHAPSGEYELSVRLDRCGFVGIGDVATRKVQVVGREGAATAPRAWVADHQGAPTLFVGGEPLPGLLYLQGRTPVPAEYAQMARAGYRVFSLGIGLGWYGEGAYGYEGVDAQILSALQGAPEGYIIPRVDISAPRWWCDLHPDQVAGYADWTRDVDDGWGGTWHQSFASPLWREQAGDALRRLIAHIQASGYADRVIGYHVATGIYGEWHLWSPSHLPDTSAPMRDAFARWASDRYGNDMQELNVAWGTKLSGPEQIRCATQEERLASDLGVFKDLSRSRFVADYWQCLHETTVGAISHFCRVVKEATEGRAIAGTFYAYMTDIGWPQEGGHLAAALAYDSPHIDFFSSPHTYSHRGLGEDGAFRAYPASIQLHGKLFIDEGDDRTFLADDPAFTHVKDADQSAQIMRREMLNVLTNRVGMWWFDMTTGWFNDPLLLQTARDLHRLAERTLERPRQSWSEIAVVYDPTTYYALADWTAGKDALIVQLCNEQFRELQKIGAPYDVLLLDDLFHPQVRDYKCYVLLNTWHMSGARREALARLLQQRGKTVVFAYAPGFSSERGLNPDHMTQLTGQGFTVSEAGGSLQARWGDRAAAIPGLDVGTVWGVEKPMAPRFSPQGDGLDVLATWADDGSPAAAVQAQDGWTSIYCGTGPIPAPLLAHAARLAGCHIWTDAWEQGANLYAGNGLLGVHTSREGDYRFRLPWPGTVRDALTGETLPADGNEFSVRLPKWYTAMYEVSRAN